MAEIYGEPWFRHHGIGVEDGEIVNQVWFAALSRLTQRQIKFAINTCMKAGDKGPCNLSVFMARARSISREDPLRYAPALELKKSRDEVRHENIALMRNALLHGEKGTDDEQDEPA